MPAPPPPMHTRWVKGQSGNPGGKPKQVLTGAHVQALIGKLWMKTPSELEAMGADENTPMLDATVANVMLAARRTGDLSKLEGLLARTVGKVPEIIEQTNKFDSEFDDVPKENIFEVLRNSVKTA